MKQDEMVKLMAPLAYWHILDIYDTEYEREAARITINGVRFRNQSDAERSNRDHHPRRALSFYRP
jgi:hypothetical protein